MPAVAMAYLDQLVREDALPDGDATSLRSAIEAAERAMASGEAEGLAASLDAWATQLGTLQLENADAMRAERLQQGLRAMSAQL